MLDYGDSNKLGEPALLQLVISNPTAIPTSFEALISHFPAAKPPTPPAQPMPCMYTYIVCYYKFCTCIHVERRGSCFPVDAQFYGFMTSTCICTNVRVDGGPDAIGMGKCYELQLIHFWGWGGIEANLGVGNPYPLYKSW